MITQFIVNKIKEVGIEKVREIVYGNGLLEIEGMRLFIESRQKWCKEKIINELN